MKNPKKHEVELLPDEYETLLHNQMVALSCRDYLASPLKRSGYMVLLLTEGELTDLTGWVAAEANHAKTSAEEEALGEVCEILENVISGIRIREK